MGRQLPLKHSPQADYTSEEWGKMLGWKLALRRAERELAKLNKDWRTLVHVDVRTHTAMGGFRYVSYLRYRRNQARELVRETYGEYVMWVLRPEARRQMKEAMGDMIKDRLEQKSFAQAILPSDFSGEVEVDLKQGRLVPVPKED